MAIERYLFYFLRREMMEEGNKIVLFIEENVLTQKMLARILEKHGIVVLHAQTVSEAKSLYDSKRDAIDLILMVACLEEATPDTIPLVRFFVSSGFGKPIIACSVNDDDSDVLIRAGATHKTEKDRLEEAVLRHLK
jgi:DNA-binding response OmpR family regulator